LTGFNSMSTDCIEYNFNQIEAYWQTYWEQKKPFKAIDLDKKPKFYGLDMFPYPSGAGLHIGHPEGYTATDILSRYKWAKGFNVLHPMGWDAFGLPAEQHAVATGIHPEINTQQNVDNFRKQLKAIGFAIDWDREVNTTDKTYYRWTQFIFLQLFKKGLAYVDEKPVWWCPALGTVLANEEVIDGRSERGNHPVERRNLRQWVLRITAYADQLLEGLKDLDWPDSTKRQQIAWIGRSEGAEILFDLENKSNAQLKVFTTRPDTLMGVTYIVIAPEHPLVKNLTQSSYQQPVEAYLKQTLSKSDLERTDLAKDKTGIFTGSYALHPITKERVPVWIGDYVLMSYGTGVVMAVPAHDERDYAFAQKYGLPKLTVIEPIEPLKQPVECYTGNGQLVNSGIFNDLSSKAAQTTIVEWLSTNKLGNASVNYKLRDWLFSRQRYWGEPFPILWIDGEAVERLSQYPQSPFREHMGPEPVYYEQNGKRYSALPLTSQQLPVLLPEVPVYQPSQSGESPLAHATDWLNVYINLETGALSPVPQEGAAWVAGRRETNTMPQWAGSCWYYLRYLDPHNKEALVSPELERYWGTPDIYIGGAEHAVLHLLYARFWHKVLYDIGLVSQPEPFKRIIHQGHILGELEFHACIDESGKHISIDKRKDAITTYTYQKVSADAVEKTETGFVLKAAPEIRVEAKSHKMSKSRGNVVSPNTIIAEYGADSLRLYEMFLGPLEDAKPWNSRGIQGVYRFLKKVWREYINTAGNLNPKIVKGSTENLKTQVLLNQTIEKVSEAIESLRFNTAIAQLMIFVNHLQTQSIVAYSTSQALLKLLAPFAPHVAEELWARLGEQPTIARAPWPVPVKDVHTAESSQAKIIVQINGKLRGTLLLPASATQTDVLKAIEQDEKLAVFIAGKPLQKVVYVPSKLVNLVL
jgi:leucyl-tRNA synthetase